MSVFCLLERNIKRPKKSNLQKIEFEVIDIGFSWGAFFLSFIWGLSNRIYFYSVLFLILIILMIFFAFFTSNFLFLLIFIIMSSIYWGIYGSSILVDNLIQKKYKPIKLISSSNGFQALLLHLAED